MKAKPPPQKKIIKKTNRKNKTNKQTCPMYSPIDQFSSTKLAYFTIRMVNKR